MFVKEVSEEKRLEMRRRRELMAGCKRFVSGHGEHSSAEMMSEIAEFCTARGVEADSYGVGDFLNGFEREIAGLLGMEDAVFMPSGTMAQQIALRIWCDRAGVSRFG